MRVGRVAVRAAGPAEEPTLRAILRATPVPGAVSVAYLREPDFFAALEVEGDEHVVAYVESAGRPVGFGVLSRRRAYLNGTAAGVGYLSSLRAVPELRGSLGLARGYRWLRGEQQRRFRVPFSLSTIVEENRAARELLAAGRRGVPRYEEIGRLRTCAVPTLRRRHRATRGGVTIRRGDAVGAARIAAHLAEVGPSRQFFPVCGPEELERATGVLRGLAPRDILVAERGGTIAGTLGLWDQSAFRQSVVTGYSPAMRVVRSATRVLAPLAGARPLPAPGRPLRSLIAALVAVRDDDPEVFRDLAQAALEAARRAGAHFLLFGFAEGDPLLAAARRFVHVPYRSRVYAVWWPEDQPGPALDGRPLHLELGSL